MKRTAPSRRAQALRTAAESLKLEKLRLRVAEAEQRLRRQAAASAEFGGEDEEEAEMADEEEEEEEEEDLEDLEFGGRAEDEDLMEAHQRLRRGAGAPGVAGAAPSSRRGGNVGGVASAARVGGVAPPRRASRSGRDTPVGLGRFQ